MLPSFSTVEYFSCQNQFITSKSTPNSNVPCNSQIAFRKKIPQEISRIKIMAWTFPYRKPLWKRVNTNDMAAFQSWPIFKEHPRYKQCCQYSGKKSLFLPHPGHREKGILRENLFNTYARKWVFLDLLPCRNFE